jgi:hypothetical protein
VLENIERRVQRSERTFTLATDQRMAEYARFGTGMVDAVAVSPMSTSPATLEGVSTMPGC